MKHACGFQEETSGGTGGIVLHLGGDTSTSSREESSHSSGKYQSKNMCSRLVLLMFHCNSGFGGNGEKTLDGVHLGPEKAEEGANHGECAAESKRGQKWHRVRTKRLSSDIELLSSKNDCDFMLIPCYYCTIVHTPALRDGVPSHVIDVS